MTFALSQRFLSQRFKFIVPFALALVVGLPLASPWGRAFAGDPPVINVPTGDSEMAAAIAKARDSLPTFWASWKKPKPSETGHALKVRFANPTNNGEHIWMRDVKKLPNGLYSGRFDDAPVYLPGKKEGDLAEFKEADISDWMFRRNDKIVGGETIRPLLKSLPKADADALRAQLETP